VGVTWVPTAYDRGYTDAQGPAHHQAITVEKNRDFCDVEIAATKKKKKFLYVVWN